MITLYTGSLPDPPAGSASSGISPGANKDLQRALQASRSQSSVHQSKIALILRSIMQAEAPVSGACALTGASSNPQILTAHAPGPHVLPPSLARSALLACGEAVLRQKTVLLSACLQDCGSFLRCVARVFYVTAHLGTWVLGKACSCILRGPS